MGGKIVPFAGYEMPVQYGLGIMQEHLFCRESSALFDVSHMGQIIVRSSIGRNDSVAEQLEKLIPVDLKNLGENRQRYGFFLNEDGGMIDDLMITNKGDHFLIVANAARKEIDLRHLNEKIGENVDAELLEGRSLLAVQGPKSEKILSEFFDDISKMKFLDVRTFSYKGKDIWISRSGYTGEDGFEVSIPNIKVENFIKLLVNNKVKPIGLGARDTLRLEAGLCLYGHDLNEEINPIEANLKWAIAKKRREEGGFNGWEKIKSILDNGCTKIRVGILPEGRIIAREGAKIFSIEGEEIGKITSGTFGPSVNAPVAMGYINSGYSEVGNKIKIEVRGKKYDAKVSALPFYKKNYVK